VAGLVADRCAVIRGKASEDGWRMMALEITHDHVRLFVKAHPSDFPSRIASWFQGFTSRCLQAGFPHLRSRLPALWPRLYFAATAGAVSAENAHRYTGARNERRWRKERPR
jgi:putative transposase